MYHLPLTTSSKAAWPSAALCSLFGPRTCTARSTTCATASLHRRHQQVRRLLKRVEHLRPCPRQYAQVRANGKRFYVHRLVMELLLARPLVTREDVHHLDDNRANNHPRNLQLLSQRAHTILTHQKHPLVAFCAQCGRPFISRDCPRGRTRYCSVKCSATAQWRRYRAAPRKGGAHFHPEPRPAEHLTQEERLSPFTLGPTRPARRIQR